MKYCGVKASSGLAFRYMVPFSLMVLLMFPSIPGAGIHEGTSGGIPSRGEGTWTIISYMNGDNDLESFIVGDLNEMEKVGSSDDVSMVVQIDARTGSSTGGWKDTRRYLV
ncbi:MAG: hypothetical protein E4H15_06245, partial [Syntrophobacterales bacterium]